METALLIIKTVVSNKANNVKVDYDFENALISGTNELLLNDTRTCDEFNYQLRAMGV